MTAIDENVQDVATRQAECRQQWVRTVTDANERGALDPAILRHCADPDNIARWWPRADEAFGEDEEWSLADDCAEKGHPLSSAYSCLCGVREVPL